ncbi:MAG: hypothetical protein QW478_11295 [Candidatus Micrarchaeaceae archaeon]
MTTNMNRMNETNETNTEGAKTATKEKWLTPIQKRKILAVNVNRFYEFAKRKGGYEKDGYFFLDSRTPTIPDDIEYIGYGSTDHCWSQQEIEQVYNAMFNFVQSRRDIEIFRPYGE